MQREAIAHLVAVHNGHGEKFGQCHSASIPYLDDVSYGTVNHIEAFDRDFIFYFYSRLDSPNLVFAIFLMGKRKSAARFYYELTIRAPGEPLRQIKFTERCLSDTQISTTTTTTATIESLSNAIVTDKNLVRSHAKDMIIHFTVKLMEAPQKRPHSEALPVGDKKKVPPKVMTAAPNKKDPKKGNLKRTPPTIPLPPPSASQSFTIGKARDGDSEAPKLALDMSSINKQAPVQLKEAPCMSPSINKNEDVFALLVTYRP